MFIYCLTESLVETCQKCIKSFTVIALEGGVEGGEKADKP